jgi:C-terminal processing protease CtpA/Prc
MAQDFGDFPKLEKDRLLRDLEILYQGLDKYHTGMYLYTSKDSLESAFDKARNAISKDLNVLEFHKMISPLVALSNEDHTDVFLGKSTKALVKTNATYLPLLILFLGDDMYCYKNASNDEVDIEGKKIVSINGESPKQIVNKIGNLFASDGYIEQVKFSDLRIFKFSKYYYYYYGNVSSFVVEFEDETIEFEPLKINDINKHLSKRVAKKKTSAARESLEFKLINTNTAYLGIHDFGNEDIKKNKVNNNLKSFLHDSFKTIEEQGVSNVILDLSKNSGGTEGNEGIVYSYLGQNYQKYHKVRAKTQEAVLDNGVDKPITLKTFGFLEKTFYNNKMQDGSYERKANRGHGLMAYKDEPKYKFSGNLYVLISPITYSGASELSNMLYTNKLGTFIGQETGGAYCGNTSGYGKELTLPHSKIIIDIPALQFVMNVDDSIPVGRGVIPHYTVYPSFEQYVNRVNVPLEFALELIDKANEEAGDENK